MYMQARYYDPVIGRFYSNDPLGFRDIHSFNRYSYGNNNPYKYTDPTGMSSEDETDPLQEEMELWGEFAESVVQQAEKEVKEVKDTVDNIEREDVYDVANDVSLTLTVLSLSPCSVACGTVSAVLDGAVALDQLSQGDGMGAIITMAPLGAGKLAISTVKKAGKIADARDVATTVLTNLTLNGGN
jgi:uncharacterized protein RhaS with RHS repeats